MAARDLRECLTIQVAASRSTIPLVLRILDEHRDRSRSALINRDFRGVARALNGERSRRWPQRLRDLIGTLEPRPGRAFGG